VTAVLKSELVEKVEVETNRTKRGKKTQKGEFSGLFAFSHFLSFLFPLSYENGAPASAAVNESMRQQTVEALQQILAAQRRLPFPGLIERNDLALRVYE
jgi:hypothetical protein